MKRNPERLEWIRQMNIKQDVPPGITIGENCNIHPTVELGEPSYSMERDEDGAWVRGKQFGDIVIEDNVEISPFSIIRRGTMPGVATIIREGTKISAFVNIGHNSDVGRHTFIGPHVNLDGGVIIEDFCYIAPHVQINWHLRVGTWSIVGAGTVVTKDIPSYSVAYGVPAKVTRKVKRYE